MSKPILAWHFLRDDRTLQFPHNGKPAVKVRVGQTLRHSGELDLCHSGLHASVRLIDALQYAPGSVICRVECGGKILRGNDKICAETRKVLWMIDGTRLLHEFACDVAEGALAKVKNPDPRSLAAIKAKRDWLDKKITDKELDAARAAAWDAAMDAARAAAWDAAWDATWDAAMDAARAADWAAARAAARAAQNKLLTRRVLAARKAGGQ